MLAISNSNYATPGGMLDTWLDGVKRANVTNAMVIALDLETKHHAETMGVTAHLMTLQVCTVLPPSIANQLKAPCWLLHRPHHICWTCASVPVLSLQQIRASRLAGSRHSQIQDGYAEHTQN